MDLLHSKETILNEVTKIIELYQQNNVNTDEKISDLTNEIKETNQVNQKLIKEIEEKDKLLMLNEKKCYDYEIMINKIQEQANKELDEKTRHDMLRAQDKEIFNRDEEIKRLQKHVNELTMRIKELETCESNDHDNEEEQKAYYENLWKKDPRNSLINDPEKVKIAIEGYKNHTNLSDVTEKCVGLSSLGINGWYNDTISLNNKKTLVEKMKEVQKQQSVEDELENPVVTEVVEDVEDSGETTEELSDIEDVDVDKKEEKVIEDVDTKEEEQSSDEEEIAVSTIKHYGKEYYIIDGEEPQYIYAIEEGGLGDVKGEMKNGKKHMYKK